MNAIASSIPGRIRIRLNASAELPRIAAALRQHSGVQRVRVNARAASLVAEYDISLLTQPTIEAFSLALLAPEQGDPPVRAEREAAPARRHWRLRANRYAKFGATGAMTISLAALLWRNKRLHTAAGVAALVFTGLHMYIHRRTLTR